MPHARIVGLAAEAEVVAAVAGAVAVDAEVTMDGDTAATEVMEDLAARN